MIAKSAVIKGRGGKTDERAAKAADLTSGGVSATRLRSPEMQALLDDHLAGGKHTAADVVAKAKAVLSVPATFVVGYFPPNTPPWPGTPGGADRKGIF